MSETLWGVFVGGIIVIIGNIVVALFQNRRNRINIAARREEQKKQFEFENGQIMITRLIEERKKWIEPLRQSLTQYSSCANRAYEKLAYFGEFPEDFQKSRDVIEDPYYRELTTITENWDKCREELSNSVAQISDPKLNKIIGELIKIPVMVSGSQIINEEKYLSLIERTETAKNNIAAAFKRIEELLSGGCE